MRRAKIVTRWIGTGDEGDAFRAQISGMVDAWSDVTGQPVEHVRLAQDAYTVDALVSDAQLAAIRNDARFAVLCDTDESEEQGGPTEPAALRAALGNLYSADIAKLLTREAVTSQELVANTVEVQLRPPWCVGESVAVDDVRQYDGNLYKCVQDHTTQSTWMPVVARALWARYYEPADDPWPWVQPTGAHDAYPVGARVAHNGCTWRNDLAANVWQPGVTGWTDLTPPQIGAWAVGVAYKVRDRATYRGNTYECLQAHTSQAGWTPAAVPALWRRV